MEKALIKDTLTKYFGFANFRNGQEEIISSLLNGNDTLVIMPTSGGKSLCYQLPALLMKGFTIVISPLISLMKDQVDALIKKGIPSAYINSSLSNEETNDRLIRATDGKYKLIYIAPERLKNKTFRNALSSFNISIVAIDEAHCISEWGHDFRPAYLHIVDALESLPRIPVIALTATATPEVQDDIISILKMRNPARFVRGFDRPNLCYSTENTSEKLSRVIEILNKSKNGASIIYCGSRKRVESYTEELMKSSFKVTSYHAGLADKFRKYAQEKFINGETNIIVATNAFGMGIDRADVRNVIHLDLPSSIESYYQEAGRAGRDGLPSNCVLLYHPADRKLQEFFINSSFPSFQNIDSIYNYLFDLNSTSTGSKSYDSIFLSDSEIGNALNLPSLTVSSVIKLLEREKILKRGSTHGLASLQITTSEERIIEYYENVDSRKKKVLEALLRGISSEVFSKPVQFDIQHFMKKYDIDFDELQDTIRAFEFADLINFHFPGFTNGITLLAERMKCEDLHLDFEAMKARKQNAVKKLNIMQHYAETDECKRNFILNYFRDNEFSGICGKCSSCLNLFPKDRVISSKQKYLQTKVFEAVYELDGNFGKTTICNYLKGIVDKQVKKYDLFKAQFFGTCREYSFEEIKQCIEQEIYNGNLLSSGELYPVITTSDEITFKLRGIKKINFNRKEINPDDHLLHKLKEIRSKLAEKNHVVERAIISDLTLRKIAIEKPDDLSKMQNISGIGKVFMQNFAMHFINEIKNINKNIYDDKKTELTKEQKRIIDYSQNGLSLEDISKKMKIPDVDIARQIQLIIESDFKINLSHLINKTTLSEVAKYVERKNNITLRELQSKISVGTGFAHLRIHLALARKQLGIK
jgi:ATP-dependent DNA helicase RecQ